MKEKNYTPPPISVVIPCYNNEKYVGHAIESVIAQTYKLWELVVVNDGSTDESEQVIQQYVATDKRIKYIKQENAGVSAARNRGVREANGEYICFLDADDWLAPQCLQIAIETYLTFKNIRVFYLRSIQVNESGERNDFVDYYGSYEGVLLWGMANFMVVRKSDFIEIGGYDEKMKTGWEDWDFSIRFLHHRCNVIVSDDVLHFYRQYSSAERVSTQAYRNESKIQKYIYCKNIEIYAEYFGSPIMQCRWERRRLPLLCKKIMDLRQNLYNMLHSLLKRT